MSRLAERRRVLYVEEAIDGSGEADGWELSRPAPDVLVARPRFRDLGTRSPENVEQTTAKMLQELLEVEEVARPVAWVYTPMAVGLLDAVDPSGGVGGVGAVGAWVGGGGGGGGVGVFLGAPPELVRRETELLARADL